MGIPSGLVPDHAGYFAGSAPGEYPVGLRSHPLIFKKTRGKINIIIDCVMDTLWTDEDKYNFPLPIVRY